MYPAVTPTPRKTSKPITTIPLGRVALIPPFCLFS
jgi:hypothetical protein